MTKRNDPNKEGRVVIKAYKKSISVHNITSWIKSKTDSILESNDFDQSTIHSLMFLPWTGFSELSYTLSKDITQKDNKTIGSVMQLFLFNTKAIAYVYNEIILVPEVSDNKLILLDFAYHGYSATELYDRESKTCFQKIKPSVYHWLEKDMPRE